MDRDLSEFDLTPKIIQEVALFVPDVTFGCLTVYNDCNKQIHGWIYVRDLCCLTCCIKLYFLFVDKCVCMWRGELQF